MKWAVAHLRGKLLGCYLRQSLSDLRWWLNEGSPAVLCQQEIELFFEESSFVTVIVHISPRGLVSAVQVERERRRITFIFTLHLEKKKRINEAGDPKKRFRLNNVKNKNWEKVLFSPISNKHLDGEKYNLQLPLDTVRTSAVCLRIYFPRKLQKWILLSVDAPQL